MIRSRPSATAVTVLAVLAFILVPFVAFAPRVDAWATGPFRTIATGAFAPFLYAGLLAADVFAPIPSSIVATLSGASLGLPLGTFASWSGMTLGSALGYGLGAGVFARWTRKTPPDDAGRAKKLSPISLGVVAGSRGVPVLAEAVTLLAGANGLPFVPFLLTSAIANLGVAATYAYVGAKAVSVNSFLLAFAGSIALPAASLLIHMVIRRSRG